MLDLLFDIGNVLLDFDYRKTATRIESQCKVPAGELYKIITSPSLFNEFESGRMTGALPELALK